MICSLLIENASKATSQGSDKKKKLQIKKTQKKAEEHFLFQKKSDAYDRHYYNYFTFEIYDFLEEKFWGNFRSLTISRIHLLTLFA